MKISTVCSFLLLVARFATIQGNARRIAIRRINNNQRLLQAQNTTNEAECVKENEMLARASDSIGDMNSEDDFKGIYFFYSETRNFTKYFTCDEDETPPICNYEQLRDVMKPLCEFYGGQLYSMSGSVECGGNVFVDSHLPVCIGRGCDIQPKIDAMTNEDCTLVTEYQAMPMDPILSDSCRKETLMLMSADATENMFGIGSLDYVYSDEYTERMTSEFCTTTSKDNVSTEQCDFSSIQDAIKAECEKLGGYLYVVSDSFTSKRTQVGSGETTTSITETENLPVCVGASCWPDVFFNEVVFPAYSYALTANLTHPDQNETETWEYKSNGFKVISDVPQASPPTNTSESTNMAFLWEIVFASITISCLTI